MDPRMILMILGFGAGLCLLLIGAVLLMMKTSAKARKQLDFTDDLPDLDDAVDSFAAEPISEVPTPVYEAPPSEPPVVSTTPAAGVVLCDAAPYLQQIFNIFTTEDYDKFNDIEVQDLAQSHANIAQNYLTSGVRRHTELVGVSMQQDLLHEQANNWEYITSEVQAAVRDRIIDLATGKVAGGDELSTYNVKYVLIFARPVGAPSYALMKASLVQ